MHEVEPVLKAENEIGESPRWDAAGQTLYWADIGSHPRVYWYRPASGEHGEYVVSLPITGWALRSQGGFVLATKRGLWFWDPATGAERFINDPEADKPTVRFNDGLADRQGRFWAGSTNEADQFLRDGSLFRMTPDCKVRQMDTGFACGNGLAWSPDSKTMYFTAQFDYVTYAYDFDPTTGEVANRRVFAQVTPADGLPDGLTVDSEGGVWSALWGGWRVQRYDPDGKLEREVRLPVPNPTSPMFGGPNLDELYITTAWYLLSDEERAKLQYAGGLFRAHTGIKGLAEPKFAG